MYESSSVILIALLAIVFSGCPVGVDYPLGTLGSEEIDKTLIGTWTTGGEDPDFRKVTISKNNDYSYLIEVFETGSMYSIDVTKFRAWTTSVGGETFIYAQPLGSSTDTDYYLYCYKMADKKTLKTYDVGLLIGGTDAATSTEAYRKEVEGSLKMEGCLSDEKIWAKE